MSPLSELPELIGFFSYSREDDEDSFGALTALRSRIQGELRGQLGRTAKSFRLWQDKQAIPSGTLWETEIRNAVSQAVFFIPIITPTVVRSPFCKFELESFLAREAELGRSDLVFPILYIRVPELEDAARRQDDPVLSIIAKRQYLDWRDFRHRDIGSTDVKKAVEQFCAHICTALYRAWTSPQERERQTEVAAQRQAEADRQRRELDAKLRAEEEARQRATELEQRKREAEQSRIAAREATAGAPTAAVELQVNEARVDAALKSSAGGPQSATVSGQNWNAERSHDAPFAGSKTSGGLHRWTAIALISTGVVAALGSLGLAANDKTAPTMVVVFLLAWSAIAIGFGIGMYAGPYPGRIARRWLLIAGSVFSGIAFIVGGFFTIVIIAGLFIGHVRLEAIFFLAIFSPGLAYGPACYLSGREIRNRIRDSRKLRNESRGKDGTQPTMIL